VDKGIKECGREVMYQFHLMQTFMIAEMAA